MRPAEAQEIRWNEARRAAEILGVPIVPLEFQENSYYDGARRVYLGEDGFDSQSLPGRESLILAPYLRHCIEDVAHLLSEYAPEIVITHSIADADPEHSAAAHLTYSAFRAAMRKAGLRELWFTCRVGSPDDVLFLEPDVLIDITTCYALKTEALLAHFTRPRHEDWDPRVPLERVRKTDVYWGRVAGVEVAEPFRTAVRCV
jgi:LmbE family N-acetylglucosaminyl deacetylase